MNLSYIDDTYNDFGCSQCSGRGLDRISKEITPLGTIDYTYDKNGRRITMLVAGQPAVINLLRSTIVIITFYMFMFAHVHAFAYEFMDESAFTKHAGYDPIPIKKSEKVLAFKGYRLDSIMFLFMTPYDHVVKELKSAAVQQFGEFPIIEKRINEEPISKNYDEEMIKRIIAKLTKFRTLTINIEDFRENSFTTKPYNVINKKTYSVLFVRVANGYDIFGVESTLIFLRRTDTWVDWYREFHTNIPIPWRGSAHLNLITETEIKLIENLKAKMKISR